MHSIKKRKNNFTEDIYNIITTNKFKEMIQHVTSKISYKEKLTNYSQPTRSCLTNCYVYFPEKIKKIDFRDDQLL